MDKATPPGVELRACILAVLAVLCVVAYAPAQLLPFIADDYIQIGLARRYGPVAGWDDLARDALYRCRATSLVLTYWTERWFGLDTLAFNVSSLAVHIVNTWLVLALGVWRIIGWRISIPAAAFFAISEGHQEAVIWYASLPELLVFTFGLISFLCWVRWLQSEKSAWWLYGGSFLSFGLALASKESAVAVLGLQLLAVAIQRNSWSRGAAGMAPFMALSILYASAIFQARSTHLHLNDGTFDLSAPFVLTLANSTGRLLWFWGLAALLVVVICPLKNMAGRAGIAAAWIIVTLLPYSFLTYMPRVPSRHTYWASAGLALLVACAWSTVAERVRVHPKRVLAAVAAVALLHNCLYLWTRKQKQFELRAAPTVALIDFARKAAGPVEVHCFPYSRYIAEYAVAIELGPHRKIVWRQGPQGCEAEPRFAAAEAVGM